MVMRRREIGLLEAKKWDFKEGGSPFKFKKVTKKGVGEIC